MNPLTLAAKIGRTLFLPKILSDFERSYLARMNRIALSFFALHVPVLALIASINRTGWQWAFALSAGTLLGPLFATFALAESRPRLVSVVHGVTAMMMGALLVHFGQGPVQVEMHFYFFALVAMLVIFANPMVIVAAAITVAVHHVAAFVLFPSSLLNYAAPWWIVSVHAGFIVLESIACIFIARATFDNLIRLEKRVLKRTRELEAKQRDLRLVLDHVEQGLVTIDLDGHVVVQSAAFDRWFGIVGRGAEDTIFSHFGTKNGDFGAESIASWMQVQMDMLPLELTLDQMPARLTFGGKHFSVRYLPISASEDSAISVSEHSEAPRHFLVVVSDVTSEIAREHAESARREALVIFERILTDPLSLLEYRDEGNRLLDDIVGGQSMSNVGRALHTLKGNSGLLGIKSIEYICHQLETVLATSDKPIGSQQIEALETRWQALSDELDRFLGARSGLIAVKGEDIGRVESIARRGGSRDALLRALHELRLEPTESRLSRFAEQAKHLAESLERAPLVVVVEPNNERTDAQVLAPFWTAFTHLVRNAIDHGCETLEERIEAGKSEHITLTLRTYGDAEMFHVEIVDDGRGIDWKKLETRAVDLGIPSETREDLVNALFADGLSTASEITEISGRGIGMGAVRQVVVDLHGTLDVLSERGRGTTVRASFSRGRVLALPLLSVASTLSIRPIHAA